MMNKIKLTLWFIPFSVISFLVHAQDLNLFQDSNGPSSSARQLNRLGNNQNAGEPTFILRGISRFADNYQVALQNQSGDIIRLTWQAGDNIAIVGYPGFEVIEVESRSVSIQIPTSEQCISAPERGVSCSGDNITFLSLSTAPSLSRVKNENLPDLRALSLDELSAQEQDLSPEQAAAIAERQNQRSERLGAQERIQPEDVPAGMRVVRTPFGDRLIPID